MQFLLTGNRFCGANLSKTRFDFDFQKGKKIGSISFTIVFSTEIDYMEVDDKIKYLQHATIELDSKDFKSDVFAFLKNIFIQLQHELIRRYETSNIFKLLELPNTDKMKEDDLNSSLSRIIADINK